MQMTFATHYRYDPPADAMFGGRLHGLPLAFGRFPFRVVNELPKGRDCVVVVHKREKRRPSFRHIAERCRQAVVIACPGDGNFRLSPEEIPDCVSRVFTTNRIYDDPRVISMPLGVRLNQLNVLRHARRYQVEDHESRPLLYMNFATDGRPWRAHLANRFSSLPWITSNVRGGTTAVPVASMVDYYRAIQGHKFVLSPPGTGADCYRHWEVLNLKSIPIIQRSVHMLSFADLPILYTVDYSEISEAYLESKYAEMTAKSYDFSRLYAEHYVRQILEDIDRLDRPEFYLLDLWKEPWHAIQQLDVLSRTLSPYYPAESTAARLGVPPQYVYPKQEPARQR